MQLLAALIVGSVLFVLLASAALCLVPPRAAVALAVGLALAAGGVAWWSDARIQGYDKGVSTLMTVRGHAVYDGPALPACDVPDLRLGPLLACWVPLLLLGSLGFALRRQGWPRGGG